MTIRPPLSFPESDLEQRDLSLENPSVSLQDPKPWAAVFGVNTSSHAGEEVTEAVALGVPAISAAVDVIAGHIASLPLHYYKDGPKGREKATKDPIYRILHDVVNVDLQTSYQFRKYMVGRLLIYGRAFAFIERNLAAKVSSLWALDPSRMDVKIENGRKVYSYKLPSGRRVQYAASEIIDLVHRPAADGISHINPVSQFRHTIGQMAAAERFASQVFSSGGIPPLVLTGPAMTPAAAGRASADVQSAIKLATEQRRPVTYLPAGYDLKPLGLSLVDTELLELRKWLVTEAARMFNIPPSYLQDFTGGTFNNTEQQSLSYVKNTLHPLLELIESELNTKLSPTSKNFCEFALDGLLRGDSTSRMNAYGTQVKNAIRTPNEIRALENLPPSDQPEADLLLVQGATVPLGLAGKLNPSTGDQGNDPFAADDQPDTDTDPDQSTTDQDPDKTQGEPTNDQ